jgi:predicted nucleic acid-binding protein
LPGQLNYRANNAITDTEIISKTNTVIAVALNEPERDSIIRATEGHDLVAPEVLPFEVGNTLTAMMKRNALTVDEVFYAWNLVQHIPVDLRRIDIRAALDLATQFDICAYDAYFLECALDIRSPLLSLDRKTRSIAQEIGIKVVE